MIRTLAWAVEGWAFILVDRIAPKSMARRLDYWMARLIRNDPTKENR